MKLSMKVKEFVEFLSKFDGEQEVILLNIDRLGHDDEVNPFDLNRGYHRNEYMEEIQLENPTEKCKTPCCVITFHGGM